MHTSSLINMKKFALRYLEPDKYYKILDIGSQEVPGDLNGSYKQIFQNEKWDYVGADLVKGNNVDIVLKDPYHWKEIKSKSFDCVICGQMFEHDEFFWVTMMEIRRILKPNGVCCIIAPSGGPEHRYPVDCYRYYPDGMRALARYVGLQVLEVYAQWNEQLYQDMDSDWRDCVLVARNPKVGQWSQFVFWMRCQMMRWASVGVKEISYDNNYEQNTTWAPPVSNMFSSLYFDTGKHFNEEEVQRVRVMNRTSFNEKFPLPDSCKQIRFDPVEGFGCIVKDLKITSGLEELTIIDSNGEKIGPNCWAFFDTTDPQFVIEIKGTAKDVTIQADIKSFSI